MIKFHILGRTTLRRADGDLDHSFQKGPKRMALLTYLLLARPQGYHRRDELLALFWPERGQKAARNALSNMLYHIREALGKYVLVSRGTEEIRLDPEKIWCDAVAFEEFLDEDAPEKALELYRGDLLPGFHVTDISNEFQTWLDGQRERLRKRAFEAAGMLAEKAEQHNDWATARRWAKKAAALKPFSEEAHARLITILKQMGNRAGALQTYQAFEERLQTEWEMEPSDKLKAIVENMDVHANPEQDESEPVDGRESKPLVVGRDDRLQPDRDSQSIETTFASSPQTATSHWWWPAAALLLILILAGWILWPGGPNKNDTTQAVTERSVAVLPFTYLGAEDSTDYFSLGMTEEILTRLAQVGELSVISRTSVMQYQDTDKNLREIAGELGVAAIVEGSVQQAGDRVRIHAQLIDTETDHHLWSESYDRELRSVLTVQGEVAARIAEALQVELLPQKQAQLTDQRDVNEQAYHLYLRAQHLRDRRDSAGIFEAKKLFREAISHDSTFAPAHSGLAMVYFWGGLFRLIPRKTAGPEALQSARRALAIDSTVVEAHLARALVYEHFERDWNRSEQAFRKALRFNPNHSEARSEYGWQLLRLGYVDSALVHMKRAVNLNPRSWHVHQSLGYAYYCNREYEKGIRELETALNFEAFPNTKIHLVNALLKQSQQLFQQGQNEEAQAALIRVNDILNMFTGEETDWQELFGNAVKGQEEQVLEKLNQRKYPPGIQTKMLLLIGKSKPTLDLIENYLPSFFQRVYVDPIFDPVRDHPRFKQIVEKELGRTVASL